MTKNGQLCQLQSACTLKISRARESDSSNERLGFVVVSEVDLEPGELEQCFPGERGVAEQLGARHKICEDLTCLVTSAASNQAARQLGSSGDHDVVLFSESAVSDLLG
jgi:hypothetical protein